MSNLARAAAVGAAALMNQGESAAADTGALSGSQTDVVPECPLPKLSSFHHQDVCRTRPVRLNKGHELRNSIYNTLKDSGTGATLVPNQQTVTCPSEPTNLESPTAVRGLDTTWIVENTSAKTVLVAWVVDGVEWSPYNPDVKAVDDPTAYVLPGEWLNVPTFDSFVYHARAIEDDGSVGDVVLQHRVGLIPIGNPNQIACDASKPDVEPVDPKTAVVVQNFARKATPPRRPCNTVDVGFRNQAGCPLHVYWASGLEQVPSQGFDCGERFRFHLGTKPATQDFMQDWESSTKFEGSFVGHTFVARLASNPSVVVDSYTIETTKIIDCDRNQKEKAGVGAASLPVAAAVVEADGTIHEDGAMGADAGRLEEPRPREASILASASSS